MKEITTKAVRVLYIDLDGTIRKGFDELGKFVNNADDVVLFDGVVDKLKAYKDAGWRIVAITNQGGVATGQLSYGDMVAAIYRTNELAERVFDKMMACIHHPDALEPENAICWCRKPRIGNIVIASQEMARRNVGEYYPPHLALFVGDRPEDEQCAFNAGIPFQVASAWRDNPMM